MMQYIGHADIDFRRWDECIAASFNSLPYAYSWYLDVLCAGQWDALIEDDYSRVFPLPWRKKKGIQYIYTPFFIQQLGVFSKQTLTEETVNVFLDSIPEKFRLVELNLNTHNTSSAKQFEYAPHLNHELDLSVPYESLRKNYAENLLRNLKKADKHKRTIRKDEDAGPIIDLFRSDKGKEIKHWSNREYDLLRSLLAECSKRGMLNIWKAYDEHDVFMAGIIFLRTDARVIFLFSATGERAREVYAMPDLIDRFIRENAGRKTVLDFEGSDDQGLARFYRSFGAKQTTYSMAVRNTLPALINLARKYIR